MATLKRKHVRVEQEQRIHPRLDFYCEASIRGIAGVRKITDISLGGFFFELETTKRLKMGQVVEVSIDLPTESHPIKVRVRFVNQNDRGIGCQFVDMSPYNRDAVRRCFETFKDTLPIE